MDSLQSDTQIDTALSSRTTENAPLEPYLVILSGKHIGKQFKLTRQKNVFGRGHDADIIIADPKISRRHGAFIIKAGVVMVEDYGSTNGTYIDERRIDKEKISLLSRIRAGGTYMRIDYKKPSEAQSEQALYQAANTDVLTQIPNRRAFVIRGQEELSFCKRNRTSLTVIMCDVDHFKKINDTFGHPAGDQVLRELAEMLNKEMRTEDTLARYGGEEFIMLLRGSSEKQALILAERVREKVARKAFEYQHLRIPATLSFGICSRQSAYIDSLESIIRAADRALYQAKKNGRNQVAIERD
ncbi:GGDEF domain-containing protein [Methylotuvimicrobium alcaliphilum]|uniref:diguanylate cyclase n=1 Tax=Methylotuvimicrobium alcaliphilum (strain DSM 19304 / NCIMB 14124 / VKM B-2133 / 20Z) TaxID=1091494 RepID=G4STY6_META2|nr:GGDEF domain-containing protein [Methylotuvimicrobium alcaliphilum]CCE22809.1 putative Ggdef family protein [Methylotuvimicrobium alcaliphilum 20Z]